ncbi:spexin prohormone 1 isoform X2 [Scleropages formosus]|uniref:Spexin hormone n=1 Tax=Scleropages formosus TaxID=113540 RepID=A0A8C9QZQ5_SCLFO|nr:spexin isoform X2 [Scleropages formosus]
MKGPKALTRCALALLLLVTTLALRASSSPKDTFQRRNWTPQAMLYLKGTQGRRFISEDRNEGDMYDTLRIVTRSQNAEQRDVSRAAAVLLRFLQQAQEEGEPPLAQLAARSVIVTDPLGSSYTNY